MSHTVIGLFDTSGEAQTAMGELIEQGFARENIDISNKSSAAADSSTPTRSADGPVSGTMSTTEVSGSPELAKGVGDFFRSLFGGDETTARNYTSAADEADAILTVHVDSQEKAAAAAAILDRNGAIDVDDRASRSNRQNAAGITETTKNRANTPDSVSIPVIEEELRVGKREVETGGARIRSQVIKKPVEADVRLREEHVVLNRHSVDRALTDTDLTNFKEGVIEITEHAEQAVVSKQARVVEEIEIGKQVTERQETIRDTVRRTDVEVDEIDAITRAANSKS